jgi:hypothetical protein
MQLLYNAVMVPYSIAFMVYQKCEEVHASSPLVYAACVPEPIKVRLLDSIHARAASHQPLCNACRWWTSWWTSASGWT